MSSGAEFEPGEPVEYPITDVLDLHTFAPRDIRNVVEAYLEATAERGFRHVRIIHGKGIGVQREAVRAALARSEYVVEWTTAPEGAGGWGATLVTLKNR